MIKEQRMTSPFSSEAVGNGTFTKFMSMWVVSLLTVSMGAVYIVALFMHVAVPDLFGQLAIAGVVFFTKAAGVADGAAISQQVMNNTIPAVTNAIVAVAPTVQTVPVRVSNAATTDHQTA